MWTRWRAAAAVMAGMALVAGCASAGVTVGRSNQRPLVTDGAATTDPATTDAPPSTEAPVATDAPVTTVPPAADGLPDIGPVAWAPCVDQPAPWECGTILVPTDYAAPSAPDLTIALARLSATDVRQRIGSLVLNPGGPGGSGLLLAFDEAASFPTELRQRFDIVGYDPRGVGASTAVRCPEAVGFDEVDFDECIRQSADLLPYLGTPNSARDLEMIRRALGDDLLSYVGFSYGSALGAVYADMFPGRVRALVLDGAVDPSAGSVNETGDFGDDYYADQDFERTIRVFHELCDATTRCAAGPHSADLLERVESKIRDLPTSNFVDGDGASLRRSDVEDILYTSMYSTSGWVPLALALVDADNGDGSTLAALSSWLYYGYPADMEAEPNFDFAHLAIECADFAGRGAASFTCEGFPDTADPLPSIVEADTPVPVLVIGTKDDPATPGRYAAQMADALVDAVAVTWDGAGHTAFLSSICVDDLVVDYLVDLALPADDTHCPFVVGASTMTERADAVFSDLSPTQSALAVSGVLLAEGVPAPAARCIAGQLARQADPRLILHQVLGVASPDLLQLRSTIDRACGFAD